LGSRVGERKKRANFHSNKTPIGNYGGSVKKSQGGKTQKVTNPLAVLDGN